MAAELQGKYQKLAQEYSKVPSTSARPRCRPPQGPLQRQVPGPRVLPPGDEAEAAPGAREVRVCRCRGRAARAEWPCLQDILECR